jgi:tetratricopeptide (TPR) repeat protein
MGEPAAGTALDAQTWDAEARQAWDAGQFTQAQHLFEKVLAVWRSLDNPDEIIYALLHITQSMRFAPDYDPAAARPLLEEAWQFAQQPGMEACRMPVQLNLAIVALEEKEYRQALRLGQQLLSQAVQVADPELTTTMAGIIGIAIAGRGHPDDGLRLYAAGMALRKRLGVPDLPPILLEHHQRLLAPIRHLLHPARIAALEAEGQALSLEQAVAQAFAFTL